MHRNWLIGKWLMLDRHLRLSGNADDSTFTSLFKDSKGFNFETSVDENDFALILRIIIINIQNVVNMVYVIRLIYKTSIFIVT